MISYYDLLGLLKNNEHPKEVYLHFSNKKCMYVYNKENGCYLIKNRNDCSGYFDLYLSDSFVDIQRFDKCIEINVIK